MSDRGRQDAPGELERVRVFLNTWRIRNDTRMPEDELPKLLRDDGSWHDHFPGDTIGPRDSEERLARLRTDLRAMVGGEPWWDDRLNWWLENEPIATRVERTATLSGAVVRHQALPGAGLTGAILAAILDSVVAGTWSRLKACPDCGWVFYDRTRSRTKTWCTMAAGGPEGRACGTIAKVRRYRQRKRTAGST